MFTYCYYSYIYCYYSHILLPLLGNEGSMCSVMSVCNAAANLLIYECVDSSYIPVM